MSQLTIATLVIYFSKMTVLESVLYSSILVPLGLRTMDKESVCCLQLNVLLDIPMTKKKLSKTVLLATLATNLMVSNIVSYSVHHAPLDIRTMVLENVSICFTNALKDSRMMELDCVLQKVELVEPTIILMVMQIVSLSSKSISTSSFLLIPTEEKPDVILSARIANSEDNVQFVELDMPSIHQPNNVSPVTAASLAQVKPQLSVPPASPHKS